MPDLDGKTPAEAKTGPELNYAPDRFRRAVRLRLWRWLRPGSPVFSSLVLASIVAGMCGTWKLRIKADERAFNACAKTDAVNRQITFIQPPDAASLRHLGKLPGPWRVYFRWHNHTPDPNAPLILRGRQFANVTRLKFGTDVDVDPWVKEISRPDTAFKSVTVLSLPVTHVSDASLKELALPDSGLRFLTNLNLDFTGVTDAGLKELARPDSGLKALTELALERAPVTDAGLKEVSRPDSGLKSLRTLGLGNTRVTDAGLAELARPGSGLMSLKSLLLDGTRVTDAGLKSLARPDSGLKSLALLSLSQTQVTDAGLSELAESNGLNALTEVDCRFIGHVTRKGVETLHRARPQLFVDR